jgi:predicted AlkP superfamily pyrophosphatase or phosphodiesterase
MELSMRTLVTWAAVVLSAGGVMAAGQAPAPAAHAVPKLAVILVVDQMRADYVDRFKDDWTGGLHRMVTQGAWFTHAAFPYLTTVTCAGHATIATGAFPYLHGVFQNAWFDRAKDEMTTCTDDDSVKPVSYGRKPGEDESAKLLLLPTFAETMRAEKKARVVSVSVKARSAIMLAGHGGDAVTWLNRSVDTWQTSSAYSQAPVPEVQAFVTSNPIEADYGKIWSRQLPVERYHEIDDGPGESPPKGWTSAFPHALKGQPADTKPEAEFYDQWERSPFPDAYLGRMAAGLVEAMRLGQGATTDVLTVSFSSPDLVGHAFGPRSQEVQDMYAHLDLTIGTLLDRLDALVGRGEYVVALSSDHGVTDIPEQLHLKGRESGRFDTRALTEALERRVQFALGPGRHVARVNGNDIYFAPGAYAKLNATGAIEGVVTTLAAQPGVSKVYRGEDLRRSRSASDPLLRAAALSYIQGRSGDIVIVPKTGWMFSSVGTTHGTASPEDQQVPILLFGWGIKPGHYAQPATPADIAPTLAALCGISMPRADGLPLRAAFLRTGTQ